MAVDRTQSLAAQEGIQNPFSSAQRGTSVFPTAIAGIEQQRAIAEVQARMIIARSNPRDPIRCTDLILQDCTRPTLAEGALYQYSRGGSAVSGPSIRLAEALAGRWGNIASGIKEISRSNGYSECVAYAWDLETGYYDERQFQVRHWRDTRSGGHPLTDERDIYELIANMGQRRKRAVLLTVIPGDVVEAAVAQCEQTLKATADTSPEALRKVADAFLTLGVSKEQIEKRCQCRLEAIRPAQVLQLRKIFVSIKDGMSDPTDWFPSGLDMEADRAKAEAASTAKAAPGAGKRQNTVQVAEKTSSATDTKQDSGGGTGGQDDGVFPPPQSDAPADRRVAPSDSPAGSVQPTQERRETEKLPEKLPEQTGQVETVEIWAIDEIGEPVDRPEPMDAMEFANWFAAQLFRSKNPDALREHNADNIGDAGGADPKARTVITDAIARAAKRSPPAAQTAPDAPQPAVVTGAIVGWKAERQPLPVPKTPKGAPHWANYGAAAKTEIAALIDDADADDWIRVNEPTYGRKAIQIMIENAIEVRRKGFKQAPPSAASDQPAADPVAPAPQFAAPSDDVISDNSLFLDWVGLALSTMTTKQQVVDWSESKDVRAAFFAVKKRSPATFTQAVGLADERTLELDLPG